MWGFFLTYEKPCPKTKAVSKDIFTFLTGDAKVVTAEVKIEAFMGSFLRIYMVAP